MNIKQQILALISEHTEPSLPVDQIAEDLSLQEIGIDSLRFMLLVLALEELLGQSGFNVGSISQVRSVGDLIAMAA
ncbi:phosphopantetheine-binding protein [Pseudomonas sp. J452]|uniref:phosphopantetheine-binding protein n=1 Tax=Pseudomonas sp. J452 TaxID=2898441 RepID=UPI0021ADBA1F|nr:phosphopantetheine-binding protein [Pseudomonas sp. J452]UUY08384.1 phosphopantetheine-binding protein [Pseudomonas sp. J452]